MIADDADPPIAALDANIVIDLAEGAPTTSERLGAEWIQNSIRLAVTDEVFIEIDDQQDADVRNQHRRYAASLRTLHADPARYDTLLRELRAAIPNPDKFAADLRHAARAAAGGARWLVTRDGQFERACAEIVRALTDVEVVSPGELLTAVDGLIRDDSYRPTDLHGSSLQLRTLAIGEVDAVARVFVNQREGESLSRLRALLDRAAADMPARGLRALVDGKRYLGLLGYRDGTIREVTICRVHRGDAQSTIARQLVAIAREEAASGGVAVRLVDAHCGEWVRRAATAEGYVPAGAGFTAVPIEGTGSRADLIARVDAAIATLPDDAVPPDLAEFARSDKSTVAAEDIFHPWRLTASTIPTFALSIEPAWAGELFDADIARGTLFPRQTGLTLQREHVYYRSPAATGGLTAPARILWYVKAGPSHQRGLRAVSTLRDIVVGDPRRLYRRFAHLGVYDETQVVSASANGRVMALRFSHTSMLPRPIALHEYRDAMRAHGTGVNLQGPQRVSEHVFDALATLYA